MMPVQLVEDLQERGWSFIEVPDEEFEPMACNVLAVGPSNVIAMDGNPVTRRAWKPPDAPYGYIRAQEISYNRAGGPTCLTRPLWRRA